MSPQAKRAAENVLTVSHKLVTIVGIPFISLMVWDMYTDFKKIRENDITQEFQIANHEDDIKELRQSVQLMGNYVWRGVK